MRKSLFNICCALSLGAAFESGASTREVDGGWVYSATSYVWGAGLSGDVAAAGAPAAHVDLGFGDILNDLDFAAMGAVEARSGRYSVLADIQYTRTRSGSATVHGLLADEVTLTSKTFGALLGGGYAIVQDERARFDLVAGVRYWDVSSSLDISGGLLGPLSASDGGAWFDGVVGVRGSYDFSQAFSLKMWALAGTGGADFEWDMSVVLGYRIGDAVLMTAGYRAMGIDYSDDGFVFDVVQHGPIVGLSVSF